MDSKLRQLGLTDNEIKVYNILLEIGENTVGPIIKKLKIHRQVAYDALSGLEKKNMVLSSLKNGRNHYRVADPGNILENIKREEDIAKSLIPEINKKLIGQKKGQEIKVFEGAKAFREFILDNDRRTAPNSTIYVVSGSRLRYLEIMKEVNFKKSNEIRARKNIKTKIVFPGNQREDAKLTIRKKSEYRFIAQDVVPPTAFQVFHDSVILISFGSEIFFIQIKNKDFRDTYINYFNLLWKIAKK